MKLIKKVCGDLALVMFLCHHRRFRAVIKSSKLLNKSRLPGVLIHPIISHMMVLRKTVRMLVRWKISSHPYFGHSHFCWRRHRRVILHALLVVKKPNVQTVKMMMVTVYLMQMIRVAMSMKKRAVPIKIAITESNI